MELCTELSQLKDKYANICIALGTFDGVHRGHQQVIGAAVARAREIGGTSLVFTFSNHPLSVVAPERCPVRLMSNEEKDLAIENEVVSIPCIVLFRDGKEVNRIIGLCKKQDILDLKNE